MIHARHALSQTFAVMTSGGFPQLDEPLKLAQIHLKLLETQGSNDIFSEPHGTGTALPYALPDHLTAHFVSEPGHQRLQVSHQRGAKNSPSMPSIWCSPMLTGKRPSCHATRPQGKGQMASVGRINCPVVELCWSWMPNKKLFFVSMNHFPMDKVAANAPKTRGNKNLGKSEGKLHPFPSGANLITMAWRTNWSNWSTLGTASNSPAKRWIWGSLLKGQTLRPTWISSCIRAPPLAVPKKCEVKSDGRYFWVMKKWSFFIPNVDPRMSYRTSGTSLL